MLTLSVMAEESDEGHVITLVMPGYQVLVLTSEDTIRVAIHSASGEEVIHTSCDKGQLVANIQH